MKGMAAFKTLGRVGRRIFNPLGIADPTDTRKKFNAAKSLAGEIVSPFGALYTGSLLLDPEKNLADVGLYAGGSAALGVGLNKGLNMFSRYRKNRLLQNFRKQPFTRSRGNAVQKLYTKQPKKREVMNTAMRRDRISMNKSIQAENKANGTKKPLISKGKYLRTKGEMDYGNVSSGITSMALPYFAFDVADKALDPNKKLISKHLNKGKNMESSNNLETKIAVAMESRVIGVLDMMVDRGALLLPDEETYTYIADTVIGELEAGDLDIELIVESIARVGKDYLNPELMSEVKKDYDGYYMNLVAVRDLVGTVLSGETNLDSISGILQDLVSKTLEVESKV